MSEKTVIKTDNLSELFKLAGMRYKSGYYTAEYWQELTGVNPRRFPQYIYISRVNGLCVWLKNAEQAFIKHSDRIRFERFQYTGVY